MSTQRKTDHTRHRLVSETPKTLKNRFDIEASTVTGFWVFASLFVLRSKHKQIASAIFIPNLIPCVNAQKWTIQVVVVSETPKTLKNRIFIEASTITEFQMFDLSFALETQKQT